MKAFQLSITTVFILWHICQTVRSELAPVDFLAQDEDAPASESEPIRLALGPLPHELSDVTGITPLMEEKIRTKRAKGTKAPKPEKIKTKTKEVRNDETPAEGSGEKNEEDAYHVRYETKFAFQNVDEFGLKVKYNKTEHVFYGDTGAGAGGGPPGGGAGGHPPDQLIVSKINSPMNAEESVELAECRKMHFLDDEFEKAIEGMCIMCHRGLGTYRYVEGCNRVDCDEFTPVDVMRAFPDCCPKCKGMIIQNQQDHQFRRFMNSPAKSTYYPKRGRYDRDKKSTEWVRDLQPYQPMQSQSSLMRRSRMPAPISFLTGHRAGAGVPILTSNRTSEIGQRPIRD